MWKFNWNMSREKWLMVLAAGICLMILAMPSGKITVPASEATSKDLEVQAAESGRSYEKELEKRVEEFLATVDGVGKADVMITVKSSEEKVLRVDTDSSVSNTEETDSSGGVRSIKTREQQENTVLAGGNNTPVVEKELMPEVEGVVISADGGGSAEIQAEISAAMEALFHVPQHKIRVLKRVE